MTSFKTETNSSKNQYTTGSWYTTGGFAGINILSMYSQIRDFAYMAFDRVDEDKDGFVCEAELKKALTDQSFSSREKSFLEFLINRLEDIRKSFLEEWNPKNNGISKADLQEYFRGIETYSRIKTFAYSTFQELDEDGNGFISRNELESALADPKRHWKERTFVEFLLRKLPEIQSAFHEEWCDKRDGISRADLQTYFRKLGSTP